VAGTPLAEGALHPQVSTYEVHQPSGEREAQANAAVLAGRRAIGLGEGLEDQLPHGGENPDAGIAHGQVHRDRCGRLCRHRDVHGDFPVRSVAKVGQASQGYGVPFG
jgi:hypothetical protein